MTPEQRAKRLIVRLASTPLHYYEHVITSSFRDAEHDIRQDIREEMEQTVRNNIELLALLAHGSDPCVYCGLPKNEMARCQHGFPGCARADDISLSDNPWEKK